MDALLICSEQLDVWGVSVGLWRHLHVLLLLPPCVMTAI